MSIPRSMDGLSSAVSAFPLGSHNKTLSLHMGIRERVYVCVWERECVCVGEWVYLRLYMHVSRGEERPL